MATIDRSRRWLGYEAPKPVHEIGYTGFSTGGVNVQPVTSTNTVLSLLPLSTCTFKHGLSRPRSTSACTALTLSDTHSTTMLLTPLCALLPRRRRATRCLQFPVTGETLELELHSGENAL